MALKHAKKNKQNPLNKHPYNRRTAPEMLRVLNEIEQGVLSIRSTCFKYGLNRNTLKLWKSKLAMRKVGLDQSADFLESMNENQKLKALNNKVRELSKALERSELKVSALETVIKVAEDDLKIKIKKSLLPNGQKNEAKTLQRFPGVSLRTVWCFPTSILRSTNS